MVRSTCTVLDGKIDDYDSLGIGIYKHIRMMRVWCLVGWAGGGGVEWTSEPGDGDGDGMAMEENTEK
jgi:hypothetical protein